MKKREEVLVEESGCEGICTVCGELVTTTTRDEGIGSYEYWGSRGVHHEYVVGSPCHDADVVEGGQKFLGQYTHTATKRLRCAPDSIKFIEVGQRYVERVYRNWKRNGGSWIVSYRHAVSPVPVEVPLGAS